MTRQSLHCMSLLIATLLLSITVAVAQTPNSRLNSGGGQAADQAEFRFPGLLAQARLDHPAGFSLMPASRAPKRSASGFDLASTAGGSLQVLGSGTVGRLTKWVGLTSSNSFIGDTTIFEDKNGLVGIGTDTPTSKLTVSGMIEITLGGLKFPDGTVQTTSAAGGLFSVAHDNTLQGNGTSGSPLGVAVPLMLFGSSPLELVLVNNLAARGVGVFGAGGPSNSSGPGGFGVVGSGGPGFGGIGGSGVSGVGGDGAANGGNGVRATGGGSGNGNGGSGLFATGGDGSVRGGFGVDARGGTGANAQGGDGVDATGGDSTNSVGGRGVVATGGGSGAGNQGGSGITALGGSGATIGLAGNFIGDVNISGKLTVTSGMKMFHIDHPLDPENKYLNHVAIESAEVLNVYSGNITTDTNGDAVVTLPDWFEALNKDFRYQLTVVGTFAQAIIASKIKGNRFAIKTNAPNVEVSWQVTGVRSDPTTRKFPLQVEEAKSERERGYYLNPDAYGQPEERGIEWARYPQMMEQIKQRRIEAEQKLKQQLNQQ